ncbi:MAG: N-acetylmuramoyl-L-alanine amidase, partial [Pricia sp.]|nr:N-acetylmuramoyl-L-alanine amidase [Pricia sp.]
MRALVLNVIVIGISFFSFSQDTLQVVIAEKGDGILSLLRKHGVNPYDHYDDFIAMNMHNLRDSVHLY